MWPMFLKKARARLFIFSMLAIRTRHYRSNTINFQSPLMGIAIDILKEVPMSDMILA